MLLVVQMHCGHTQLPFADEYVCAATGDDRFSRLHAKQFSYCSQRSVARRQRRSKWLRAFRIVPGSSTSQSEFVKDSACSPFVQGLNVDDTFCDR